MSASCYLSHQYAGHPVMYFLVTLVCTCSICVSVNNILRGIFVKTTYGLGSF